MVEKRNRRAQLRGDSHDNRSATLHCGLPHATTDRFSGLTDTVCSAEYSISCSSGVDVERTAARYTLDEWPSLVRYLGHPTIRVTYKVRTNQYEVCETPSEIELQNTGGTVFRVNRETASELFG